MTTSRSLSWPALIIAGLTALGAIVAGVPVWIAIGILAIWAATLWIAALDIEPVRAEPTQRPLDTDRMAELIEFAGNPLILTDRNRIVIANRAARKTLGAHIVGQDVRMALRHPDALKMIDKGRSGSTLARGMSRRRDVWRISRQELDGSRAVVELINRTAEEDIGRAHTDFVANASHELRTPLASIIGYVETLEEGGDGVDEDTRTRFRRTILREARRLQQLVGDLMSLSRIEAEKHDAPAALVPLTRLVERAARDAAGPERSDRLTFELEDDLSIMGDAQQLEQLVRNLVDNALKYGRESGPVAVSLAAAEDGARIALTVTDEGDGIPAEHLPHLTRRFYRTDPGRSRASGGTGLGLAIVKHIVERHRAKLDIRSRLGEGTTISVRFPVTEAV